MENKELMDMIAILQDRILELQKSHTILQDMVVRIANETMNANIQMDALIGLYTGKYDPSVPAETKEYRTKLFVDCYDKISDATRADMSNDKGSKDFQAVVSARNELADKADSERKER